MGYDCGQAGDSVRRDVGVAGNDWGALKVLITLEEL